MLSASHGHGLAHEIEIIGVGEDANVQESVVDNCLRSRNQAPTVAPNIANDENKKFHLVGGTVKGDLGLVRCFSVAAQSLCRGEKVGQSPEALLPFRGEIVGNMGVEADTGKTDKVLIPHLAHVDGSGLRLDEMPAGLMWLERDSHFSGQDVFRAYGDHSQSRLGADQSVGNFKDGAVPAGGDNNIVAVESGLPRRIGSIPRTFGFVNIQIKERRFSKRLFDERLRRHSSPTGSGVRVDDQQGFHPESLGAECPASLVF